MKTNCEEGQLVLHDLVFQQILANICFFPPFLINDKNDKTQKDEQLLTKVSQLQLTQSEISVSLSSRDSKLKANVFCHTNRTESQNLSCAWF